MKKNNAPAIGPSVNGLMRAEMFTSSQRQNRYSTTVVRLVRSAQRGVRQSCLPQHASRRSDARHPRRSSDLVRCKHRRQPGTNAALHPASQHRNRIDGAVERSGGPTATRRIHTTRSCSSCTMAASSMQASAAMPRGGSIIHARPTAFRSKTTTHASTSRRSERSAQAKNCHTTIS